MAWGGQFGTPGYAQSTIPTPIVQQYPGAKNYQSSLRMFGDLASGPYSKGLGDIAAAQSLDPAAQQYQQNMAMGGGAYAPPGSGTAELGNLFGAASGSEATRQQVNDESAIDALKGMGQAGMGLANSIDEQQSAAIALERANNEALSAEISGALDIASTVGQLLGFGSGSQAFSTAAAGSQAGAGGGGGGGGVGPGGTAPSTASASGGYNFWGSPLGQMSSAVGQGGQRLWDWMSPSVRGMFGATGGGVQPIYPATPGYGTGNMAAFGP